MDTLYYDCFSGISGDMNLGAMLDLGIEKEYLVSELLKLNLPGWELITEVDQRHGIYGTKASVLQTRKETSHRHLSDIRKILNDSSLGNNVKDISLRIFKIIAEAEAKVHSTTIDKVHFHEVGAVDSIIDVVGAAVCFDVLKVDKVIVGKVELGGGTVKCEHGVLPVPAPATAEIVKGIPVSTDGVNFEATTPTGAAILKALGTSFGKTSDFSILKSGYGIGQKINPDKPNILRVFLGELKVSDTDDDGSLMLECNIDDMNPEWYDSLITRLINGGAADVFLTQIIMKKGRPGTKVNVLTSVDKADSLKEILFKHSTTLGLRYYPVSKSTLEREFRKITTPYGELTVKLGYYRDKLVSVKPEYADCLKISEENNIPLKEVNRIVMDLIKE